MKTILFFSICFLFLFFWLCYWTRNTDSLAIDDCSACKVPHLNSLSQYIYLQVGNMICKWDALSLLLMRDLDGQGQFLLNAKIQQWKLLLRDTSCLPSIIFALSKDTAENDRPPHTPQNFCFNYTNRQKWWGVFDRENTGNYFTSSKLTR